MPRPVISSKDDVVAVDFHDRKGNSVCSLYYRWELGDADEEDELYYARMPGDKSQHAIQQINAALEKMPAERIFFPLPIPWPRYQTRVTVASTPHAEPEDGIFLKRPWLLDLDYPQITNRPEALAMMFADEVRVLERLSRFPPHPNIVQYHGCRVRKGRVTAIQLGRVEGSSLAIHMRSGRPVDKAAILAGLTSAVDHLHRVVGIAHNDISPMNIMVSPDGRIPTLIDFGSADLLGAELSHRPFGTFGEDPLDLDEKTLYDGPSGDPTSRKSRDLASLKRLAVWLDDPQAVDSVCPEAHACADANSPAADSNSDTCHDAGEMKEARRPVKRKLSAGDT
ncbi:hypothetical protein N656DRAFT_829818 [Canariomyces notabilis]|uniref:Protein kinase domain-containing protein n=1 Tax=Canariomyces notabilis TaxID=2074819 RepID=A0AAN6TBX0_9PEZI|nr:hypothetical protein N656DRAFT_829818 [Canariomyces arenarius]